MLINPEYVDRRAFDGFDLIDVANDEPAAANALSLSDTVILPECFPKTAAMLQERGFRVTRVDVSELQKAEAGVTCCSLLFRQQSAPR